MSSQELPGSSGETPQNGREPGRTRRSLLGLGGVVAGLVVGTVAFGTPARATPAVTCFLRGTNIRTPNGERRIEDLAIGDLVATVSGEAKAVKWIGRQRFRKAAGRAAWVKDTLPVRVKRFAIDNATPSRDLYLSQAHALYIDGELVPAINLLNGNGIALHPAADVSTLDYFNIELASHDVIYAEGAPVETLLAVGGNREMFDNFIEYERLYGSDKAVEPVPFMPRLSYNGGRSEIRSRIRSAISPLVDRRTKLDRIRDRLAGRSTALDR